MGPQAYSSNGTLQPKSDVNPTEPILALPAQLILYNNVPMGKQSLLNIMWHYEYVFY